MGGFSTRRPKPKIVDLGAGDRYHMVIWNFGTKGKETVATSDEKNEPKTTASGSAALAERIQGISCRPFFQKTVWRRLALYRNGTSVSGSRDRLGVYFKVAAGGKATSQEEGRRQGLIEDDEPDTMRSDIDTL